MKMAILGCGNMAASLVKGYHKYHQDFTFYCYTPSQTKAIKLASEVRGVQVKDISDLPECDYYLIGCKPAQFKELAATLKPKLNSDSIIISMMAGVGCETIEARLGVNKIIRVMPNTPSLIGLGVNLLYLNAQITDRVHKSILQFFTQLTSPYVLSSEEQLDLITGVTGSGPAYLFEMARIFDLYLTSLGISQDQSRSMICDLFVGAGSLMKQSDESFETLRNNVTSKGGVTYAALKIFSENNLDKIFLDAFAGAYQRTLELKEENSAAK